ncbi:MAG: ornithine cyclodeaminase family protein [Gammaproteobacteria bacterium]|nr:ornithine cyclodeaminase family protein [Gammaproteobacteria bacterium]
MRRGSMYIVSEAVCEEVFSRADAFSAVESVFAAMASGEARNFPVIREQLGYQDAIYGFKSGFDRAGLSLGLKSGGYWPNNAAKGLTNHQSTVFLFDPDTGKLDALVGGNYLTAIRTAAASSVSIAHLARKDASVLGMVGAGHQSTFQLRAALEQRSFEKILGWNLHPQGLDRLAAVSAEVGLPFEAVEREQLAADADVIITITSAHEALLLSDWIKPGTHIACMGTDTAGKQEIDARIFNRATAFTDEIAQAITIGETQHAFAEGIINETGITAIGDVINGTHPGRGSADEVTIFDGTGVGLQDLAAASASLRAAIEQDKAASIEL